GAGDSASVYDAPLEAGDEERGLPCAVDQMLVVELGLGQEDLGIGPVLHPGSGGTALGLADDVETGRFLERLEGIVGARRAGGIVEAAGHTSAEGHLVHLRTASDRSEERRVGKGRGAGMGADDEKDSVERTRLVKA